MPSHFKFKEYCPLVFRNLRERFGIDDQDFLVRKAHIATLLSHLYLEFFVILILLDKCELPPKRVPTPIATLEQI